MYPDQVTAVLDSASIVSYEHTGVGYFLTVRHATLPSHRVVCDKPLLTGRYGDVECGFVVFLEDGELTLECHSWGAGGIPENFREWPIEIKAAA